MVHISECICKLNPLELNCWTEVIYILHFDIYYWIVHFPHETTFHAGSCTPPNWLTPSRGSLTPHFLCLVCGSSHLCLILPGAGILPFFHICTLSISNLLNPSIVMQGINLHHSSVIWKFFIYLIPISTLLSFLSDFMIYVFSLFPLTSKTQRILFIGGWFILFGEGRKIIWVRVPKKKKLLKFFFNSGVLPLLASFLYYLLFISCHWTAHMLIK